MKIPLDKIKPDLDQPRKAFNDISVKNLARSLEVEGLIHSIELDKDYRIIVGEMRYRAAKLLGWKEIEANINPKPLNKYERLRRQMAENLQQSGSKGGGAPMNPIDTARAWVQLYELKTGQPYRAGHTDQGRGRHGFYLSTAMTEIANELGVSHDTVIDHLKLLLEPEVIIEAIRKDAFPRTYIREANMAPPKERDAIKQKILKGEYQNREEIKTDVKLFRKLPDLAQIEIKRKQAKESVHTNKILNSVTVLGLALENIPFADITPLEQGLVADNLRWIQKRIDEYLSH